MNQAVTSRPVGSRSATARRAVAAGVLAAQVSAAAFGIGAGLPDATAADAPADAPVRALASDDAVLIAIPTVAFDLGPHLPDFGAPIRSLAAATVTAVAERESARVWPLLGRLNGHFGEYRGSHRHAGLDIKGSVGTPIVAAAAGRVVFVGSRSAYGQVVEIDHGHGVVTRYAHLRRAVPVAVGQFVEAGALIGEVGMTGRTSGPHLHFEVRIGDVATDPLAWLPALMADAAA